MFECDSADMSANKFPLTSMGARADGLACADEEYISIGCQHYLLLMLAADAEVASAAASSASKI